MGKQEPPTVESLAARLLPSLRDSDFLRLLGDDGIVAVLRNANLLRLRRRQVLFREGDDGHSLFAVVEGHVKIARSGPVDRDLVLDLVGPGSVFGELGAIVGLKRAADAIASSACLLVAIDGRRVAEALRSREEAVTGMFRLLADRLARTTRRLEELMFLPADIRLARTLLGLTAVRSEGDTTRNACLVVALSQSDLGDLAGLTRESVNKQLASWRADGIVQNCAGDRLEISRPDRLAEIARH